MGGAPLPRPEGIGGAPPLPLGMLAGGGVGAPLPLGCGVPEGAPLGKLAGGGVGAPLPLGMLEGGATGAEPPLAY